MRLHAIIAIDRDFPRDSKRVLIRGSRGYCMEYLARAKGGGGWLDSYLLQPARWDVSIKRLSGQQIGRR